MNIFDSIAKRWKSFINDTEGKPISLRNFLFPQFGVWSFSRENEYKLTEQGYIDNSNGYAVIRKLFETAAAIPEILENTLPNGTIETINDPNNDLYSLLKKPNLDQTSVEYKEECYLQYLVTGDTFEYKLVPSGFQLPSQLKILPSYWVEVFKGENNQNQNSFFAPVTTYQFTWGGSVMKFPTDLVIHTKNFDPSYNGSWKGLSPLQANRLIVSASNQNQEAKHSMLKTRGAVGIISNEKEDYPLEQEEREAVQSELDKRLGEANKFNKVVAFGGSAKFQQMGLSAGDLKILEMDVDFLRKICNAFGLPSQLFNDPQNKTFNNLAEAKKALYTEAAIPLAQKFVDSKNENLVPEFNRIENKNYCIKLDTSKIEVLQKDKKAEAQKNEIESRYIRQTLTDIVKGNISREQASIILQRGGMTEDEANQLVSTTPISNNGEEETI